MSRDLEPPLLENIDGYTQFLDNNAEEEEDPTYECRGGLSAAGEAMKHSDFNHDELQPAFIPQDVVGALMLKLKDKHRLTNTAIEEVIQLSDIVANHMVRDTLKVDTAECKYLQIEYRFLFFKDLPKIAEKDTNLLS